jgi:glycosyltransferase involved in cell wall biosynthesis
LKILWINHRDPTHPEAGGAEVHIHEVGKRLVERGHEITLLAERCKGSRSEEEIDGMNVRRFGGKFTLHLYAPYFVMRYSDGYDVVIDDIAHAVPFWSPKFTKKPVIAVVHHVHQKVLDVELSAPLRYIVKGAERTIKDVYFNIMTVSDATKEDLMEMLGVPSDRITVIHHGIDHEVFRPGSKFNKPTILWIGRMKRYKNLDHIIRAFSIVKKSVKEARLVLVGSGPEESKIRALIRTIGLEDVTLTGRVSEAEKIRLLQGAWVIVYTSVVEGWGLGILEAAACGTPAVAYDTSVFREAIKNGKTGLLVKYGDIASLAEALKEILTNDTLREELSRKALANSYNFDWNKTTSQTEQYLKEIAQ